MRRLGVVGVPSSAGAHWRGQEKAPAHLRRAGLTERLRDAGCDVHDYGDLPVALFRPDKEHRQEQNMQAVVEVAQSVADRVEAVLKDQRVPVVIGGDCTITVGTVAGLLRGTPDLGLLYFDGGPDLNTPSTSPTGVLDSMGLAYMLGFAPGLLSLIGPRTPLLRAQDVALLGFQPADLNAGELRVVEQLTCPKYPVEACFGRAAAVAGAAVSALETRAPNLLVHFDVDVIDFVDFPIADVPSFHGGLPWTEVVDCLRGLIGTPSFAGLVITEFNPDRDPEGLLAPTFVSGVVSALAGSG